MAHGCGNRLSCLPDEWATKVFVGEVSGKKSDAEQSAASLALAAIQADPLLMSTGLRAILSLHFLVTGK